MPGEKMKLSGSSKVKSVIQIIGTLITIIGLFFSVQRTWTLGQSNWLKIFDFKIFFAIFIGGTIYGLDEFFLAWAWQKLLNWFGEKAGFTQCNAIYGRTQIAKYIPGNLFHLPSRHFAGNQAGFKHSSLAGAAIYEIIGLVVASGTIALIGILINDLDFGKSIILPVTIILVFILLLFGSQSIIIYFKLGQKIGFPARSILDGIKHLLPIWLIYILFFSVVSGIIWFISGISTGSWINIPFQFIFSAYAISWLAGFITPGAPAGIGVREATMIVLLRSFIGEPASILIAIIARIIVTIGDMEYYGISFIFDSLAKKGFHVRANHDIF